MPKYGRITLTNTVIELSKKTGLPDHNWDFFEYHKSTIIVIKILPGSCNSNKWIINLAVTKFSFSVIILQLF